MYRKIGDTHTPGLNFNKKTATKLPLKPLNYQLPEGEGPKADWVRVPSIPPFCFRPVSLRKRAFLLGIKR